MSNSLFKAQSIHGHSVLAQGISVFFPAYNEEDNVGKTITNAMEILDSLECEYEIIIIDDGSKDKTSEIVKNFAHNHKNIILKKHIKNIGYGGALKTGFNSCKYGLIFFSDCDLQFDLSELKKFITIMEENKDVDAIIGYRIARADSLIRKFNAACWNLWCRLLFKMNIKDIDCAFKLFKKNVIDDITVHSSGALVSVEILSKLDSLGYKIIECGVNHYPRPAGRQTGANPKVILKALYESLKLYKNIKSSKY